MNDRITAKREAARRALQLRRSLSVPREYAVNVFDIASSIGVEIQFLDLPSLEGMFYRGPDPKIILPSIRHRSRGRVAFSCAHELGHFDLGHGTRVDEYIVNRDEGPAERPLEELTADTFAATFLMPRPAVLERFHCRGLILQDASPIQIFQAATELDVGYGTLCKHLRYALELVDNSWLASRTRVTPKQLRESIAPGLHCSRLVLLDQWWPHISIDLEVGDCIAVSSAGRLEAPPSFLKLQDYSSPVILRAQTAGEVQLTIDDRQFDVRVARAGYVGLYKYRFLEEGVDE